SANDPAGTADPVTFGWSLTGPGLSTPETGSDAQFSFTPSEIGTYTLQFTADDGDGGVATTSLDVHVDPMPVLDLRVPGNDAYVTLNSNFDEGNHDSHGGAVRDNKPDLDFESGSVHERATITDTDLRPAQLVLNGTPGSWKLTYADS